MPQSAPETVTGKKIFQIVPLYFTALFILFTTILLYWTYISSNTLATEQLKKNLNQRHANAENSLTNTIEKLELMLTYIASNDSLLETVVAGNQDTALTLLNNNRDLKLQNNLDILFIKDLNKGIWVDVSSTFFDLPDVLPLIAARDIPYGTPSQIYTFSPQQSDLVIIGQSVPIIHQETGQVLATLFGGIVVNNDMTLVNSMRKKSGAEALVLLHQKRILAATQGPNTALIQDALTRMPSPEKDFRRLKDGFVAHYQALFLHGQASSLELVFVIQDTIFDDIKNSYRKKSILIIWLVIALSLLTLYLVRKKIIAPLNHLSSYAAQIGQEKPAVYHHGPIWDFNKIGVVMTETVQGLRQTTVQLQDEIARRQQVMDQLSLHRAGLEQIVAMRTQELKTTNMDLITRNKELDQEKTERLQTQDEMRQLAEAVKNSPVSIVITDHKGIIEYVNPKFTKLTQYSAAEAIGQNPRILNAGQQPPQYFKEMWHTILSGKDWHGEFCNKKKDGTIFWELASISPILDSDGTIGHFVTVKEDITARKLTEASLKKAQQAAEEASRQKSLFLANMSHEIRTPMNALIGLSELALETRLTEQQYDYLSKIHSSSQGLLTVLNDILDYSKIEAGKLELEDKLFSLSAITEEVKDIFLHQASHKGLGLQTLLAAHLPSVLHGDPTRLRQVLINLIGNALKFTTQGGITLTIALLRESRLMARIQFTVSDSGIGIPPDKLANLFVAFSQVDASHTRKYGGTGLGLAISKELITMMGGELSVRSTEGTGSTFSFTLDLGKGVQGELPLQERQNQHEKLKRQAMKQLAGARILLVEDNEVNQQISAEILAKAGITVEIAPNGAVAVEKYQLNNTADTPFSAILMDIQMPLLDGYEATQQIRALEKDDPTASHIPIIAMTAHTMPGDREKGLASGMDDYIGKPFDMSELFLTLAQWVSPHVSTEEPRDQRQFASSPVPPHSPQETLAAEVPGIYLRKGLARLGGDTGLYLRLLKEFGDQYGASGQELGRWLQLGHYDKVARLLHTLKGIAANLCCSPLHELAEQLEAIVRTEGHYHKILREFTHAWDIFQESMLTLDTGETHRTHGDDIVSREETRKTVCKRLERLLGKLDTKDFQAVKEWQVLRNSLQGTVATEKIAAIDYCLTRFDFQEAAPLVQALHEELLLDS